MYFKVLCILLCVSSGTPFVGHSQQGVALTDTQAFEQLAEYPRSEESSKRLVLEPPLIKRGIDPLSIPRLIREPPLKRGEKRDSYVYPSSSSKLTDRVPLREPPLKRGDYDSEPLGLSSSEEEAIWQDSFGRQSNEGKSQPKILLED